MVHYLDHAAGTPVHPAAVVAMNEVLTENFGNPSGSHRLAREANRRLDAARACVAESFGLAPGNVVFTSGGTEADSMAVHGSLQRAQRRRPGSQPRLVCSAIEHHAVLDPVEVHGGITTGVTAEGVLDLLHLRTVLGRLADAGTPVAMVSVMAANNETGVVQPVAEAVAITRELAPDALFHTDAVQFGAWRDTAGLAEVTDLMSVSAHKLGGPKGVGFLAVADGVDLPAHQIGGGQERGRRGGTQNVPGIVAMAAAVEAMVAERDLQAARVRALRDDMVERIVAGLQDVVVTGRSGPRLPNIAHLCFPGVESETLLFLLEKDEVMASAASSCASGAQQASHVMAAMGVSDALALGSVRLSLGYTSTPADVDAAVDAVIAAVSRIRDRG
jgi:cysteine desulfurase